MMAGVQEVSKGVHGVTALIVDDSAVARSILTRALRLSGISIGRVIEAADGVAGLDVLSRESISLALVDLNMPRMGGMEMLEKARAIPNLNKTPMVVVSTEGSETQIAKVRALGAGFLRKPFTPESLVDIVQSILTTSGPSKLDQALFQVSAQVLAELCFLLPEERSTPVNEDQEQTVSVSYSGSSTGQVTVGFAGIDMGSIAGDMMGCAPNEAFAEDAMRELTNVICGHSLPVFYGTDAVYRLSAPSRTFALPVDPLVAEAVLVLRGGHVRARLYGKQPTS
jgi:two-component system, chemotaxis family, chemotaxis protein CheY